jgi:hypothetical protein
MRQLRVEKDFENLGVQLLSAHAYPWADDIRFLSVNSKS